MGLTSKIGPLARFKIWWRVLRDPRTPLWSKGLFLVLVVGYALWPLDLIPDFLIGWGWLDDLVMVSVFAWLATQWAPRMVRRDARQAVTGDDDAQR